MVRLLNMCLQCAMGKKRKGKNEKVKTMYCKRGISHRNAQTYKRANIFFYFTCKHTRDAVNARLVGLQYHEFTLCYARCM